jgi:hypothetical protein
MAPLDLIWKSTYTGESLGSTDATPVTINAIDNRGREYEIRFTVRNDKLTATKKSLKELKPVRRIAS